MWYYGYTHSGIMSTVRFAVKKSNGKRCLYCNGTVHAFEPKMVIINASNGRYHAFGKK